MVTDTSFTLIYTNLTKLVPKQLYGEKNDMPNLSIKINFEK